MASNNKRNAKETAVAQAGPPKDAVTLSATPRIIPERRVPFMLPAPAITAIAKTLPMNCLPMYGSMGMTLTRRPPAILVVAIDRPKPIIFTVIGLAPMSLTAALFWETPLATMPMYVFVKKK